MVGPFEKSNKPYASKNSRYLLISWENINFPTGPRSRGISNCVSQTKFSQNMYVHRGMDTYSRVHFDISMWKCWMSVEQRIWNSRVILVVLKNHKGAPLHFVLWCNLALSFCTLEALSLWHSCTLIARSFQCHSGITTGAKYIDGHLSMSTPVMHCASAQSLWGNRKVHAGVGGEYWLLESRAGHTVNCTGIIWLNPTTSPHILHRALRNSAKHRRSKSTAIPLYKINIYKRRMLKSMPVFLYIFVCLVFLRQK